MSASSTPSTPRQLEPDVVADVVQLYLVGEEAISREEQEDVGFYNLYDSRTPRPCLKSPRPDPKHDSSLGEPVDREKLAEKLQIYIKSTTHNNGLSDFTQGGPRPGVGSSNAEGGDLHAPTANENKCLYKN